MKLSMNMNDDLVKKLDEFAKKKYLSRSSVIVMACTKYLNEAELVSNIKDISLSIRKIADSNTIDEESKRKLEEFESIAKMFI